MTRIILNITINYLIILLLYKISQFEEVRCYYKLKKESKILRAKVILEMV